MVQLCVLLDSEKQSLQLKTLLDTLLRTLICVEQLSEYSDWTTGCNTGQSVIQFPAGKMAAFPSP